MLASPVSVVFNDAPSWGQVLMMIGRHVTWSSSGFTFMTGRSLAVFGNQQDTRLADIIRKFRALETDFPSMYVHFSA
jgi:hypothetical protein